MKTGTPAGPGCPSAFLLRPLSCAALLLLLLLLSSGGSDRLTLFAAYFAGAVCLGECWISPHRLLGLPGRLVLGAAVATGVAGVVVSPVPRMGAFIGFDILFPVVLALCVTSLVGRTPRTWFIIAAGAVQGVIALVQAITMAGRPSGTFGNPNYAALVMVLAVLAAMDRAVTERNGRIAALTAGAVSFSGIVATASKSAFAALAAGFALLLWRLPSRLRLLPLVALALFLVVPNPVGNRLRHWSSDDRYAFQRPMIWSMAVEAWSERPVTGQGPGGFVPWARTNNRPVETTPTRFAMRPETAHNQPLQTAVDYGVPGLLVLGSCLFLLASGLTKAFRAVDSSAWLPAAGLAALLPASLLFPILESPPLVFVLALCLSLHRGPSREAPPGPPSSLGRIAATAVPTLLAVLLVTEALHTVGARLPSVPVLRLAAVIPPQNPARWQDLATLRLTMSPPGDAAAAAEALACLDLAARLDPTDPGTMLRRVDILLARLNTGARDPLLVAGALRTMDSAARLDPRNPFIPFASGRLRLAVGLAEQARLDFSRAVTLEPNYVAARELLAETLERLDLPREATRERRATAAIAARWKGYAPQSPYESAILAVPDGSPSPGRRMP